MVLGFSRCAYGCHADPIVTEVEARPKRALVVIAKILQTLANGIAFNKEKCMFVFNPFIEKIQPLMRDFLDQLSVCTTASQIS